MLSPSPNSTTSPLHARTLSSSTASLMASSTGSDYSQRHHHRLVIFPSSCHRSATFNLPPCHVKSSTASTMRQDVSSFSVARYCSSFTTLVSNRAPL
ncbi:hypothetical protein HN51_022270 [Arachis hypogaea]